MENNKKLWIYIGIIVVLTIILSVIIFAVAFVNKKTTNNNSTRNFEWEFSDNTSSAEETVIVDSNVQLEEKTVDSVDYSNYAGKVDLSTLSATGSNITVSGSTITITAEGTYYFTGTAQNANIVVNAGDKDNVILVFENANITSSNTAVINGINAKKITINLVAGSTNTFTDSSNYTVFTEDDEPDATVFSKTDLVISGTGTLVINANYKDGIASKDDLIISDATLKITSADDGIRGKDSVQITNANFTINSKGDGIKSTNDTDEEKGYILISNANITVQAEADAIQAERILKITSGNVSIKTTGDTSNDNSSKGLKAGALIQITGGTITIDSTDDAIHSNGNVYIDNGKFTITSKDDVVHGDGLVEINGGTFNITAAEGIEATYVKINDGTINISASDDGINAANKSTSYSVTVEINGGNITINMGSGDTDGVDSNGNIVINGGTINVTGQSAFDYDGTGTINGGTVICNGEKVTTLPNQFMGGGMQGGNFGGGRLFRHKNFLEGSRRTVDARGLQVDEREKKLPAPFGHNGGGHGQQRRHKVGGRYRRVVG